MITTLSRTLRPLRQQAGLTQAALAEALGVSDRAVSRWETGQALPDVTLLPQLALLLNTSVDALLDVDPLRRQEEILQITEECTRLLRDNDAPAAVALMRRHAARFPNQPELMVYLARALLALKTEASAREALKLCRAAEGRTMRLSTAYGCKQVMAYALHRLGKPEQAAQLVEDEMPAIWVCRELMLPRVAPQERAELIRRSNVRMLADLLTSTLDTLGAHSSNAAYAEAAARIRQEIAALSL